MGHLLGNSVSLSGFSFLLYGYFGRWVYPVLSLGMGALCHLITLWFYPMDVRLLGASGMIYAMMGFWVAAYFGLDRRHTVFQRLFRVFGFCLIWIIPTSYDPAVSYLAHGIGFLVGIVVGSFFILLRRSYFRQFEVWSLQGTDEEKEGPWIDADGRFHS